MWYAAMLMLKLATVRRAEKATVALNTRLNKQKALKCWSSEENTMTVFIQFSLCAVLRNVKIKRVFIMNIV